MITTDDAVGLASLLEKFGKPYKLNLGSGSSPQPGYINIDSNEVTDPDLLLNLETYPWPFEDNSVGEVIAIHFAEHVIDLIKVMDEVWRICQPKARVYIQCPYFTSVRATVDPTHVRYMSEPSFLYFNQEWLKVQKLTHYGIKANFNILGFDFVWNESQKGKADDAKAFAKTHYWNAVDDFIAILEVIK